MLKACALRFIDRQCDECDNRFHLNLFYLVQRYVKSGFNSKKEVNKFLFIKEKGFR